jgi:hypothetical protein
MISKINFPPISHSRDRKIFSRKESDDDEFVLSSLTAPSFQSSQPKLDTDVKEVRCASKPLT